MTSPIAANLLDQLAADGISPANVMEEIIWLNWKGLNITSIDGRAEYLRMSRAGRNFAMNRRNRNTICDYQDRVADVIVTNVECFHAVRLEEKVG